ncbi:MAG: macro domain-containing protein [Flammeovirgaceae bacterium]|nr:macro domain-containing protein [Flammeovirgaceae bacterium]
MAKEIEYIKGDATSPQTKGNKIIVHVCNDIGGWGRGFVMALSNKWKTPEQEYRGWFASKENFALGKVQFVQVEEDLWVANLIGQHKTRPDKEGNPPVRYSAIQEGMKEIASHAGRLTASIHMPRIGCGLAGGKWENIEPILNEELISKDISTVVYDFE